jgi:uncharacterized low-complexity protein
MKKMNKTPLASAMGAALLSSLAATATHVEANPFAMSEMSSGYMQLAEGEMKCGASMGMGEPAKKTAEGACAGAKTAPAADASKKKTEGSCGEGKCGAMMKDGKMKQGMENTCGAMMKGKEGACGAGMKGAEGGAAPAAPAAPAK